MSARNEVLTTGQAPWITARHEMDLVLTSEYPPDPDLVTAGFVFVYDAHERLLLTHVNLLRRGWDIPGGHIELGEPPVAGAARELAEETGFRVDPAQMALVGWQRFRLLERPADDYPYPYPLSYLVLYALRHDHAGPSVRPAADSECGPAEWCTADLVESRCAGLSWFPFVTPVRARLFD